MVCWFCFFRNATFHDVTVLISRSYLIWEFDDNLCGLLLDFVIFPLLISATKLAHYVILMFLMCSYVLYDLLIPIDQVYLTLGCYEVPILMEFTYLQHAHRDGRLEEVVLRHLGAKDGDTVIAKDIRFTFSLE